MCPIPSMKRPALAAALPPALGGTLKDEKDLSSTKAWHGDSIKPHRVLICSESVPPQVNGIARRIGMYADGLRKLGCDVDVIHPDSPEVLSHVNPWNFTARMMIIRPLHLFRILCTPYDIVHVVMPANLSAMAVLACFKVLRCVKRQSKPTLVVSWHCNIIDYIQHFSAGPLRFLGYAFFFMLFGMLPVISDRVLTPTKKSEPQLVRLWRRGGRERSAGGGENEDGVAGARAGVCLTGVNKEEFTPASAETEWGRNWTASKEKYLAKEGKRHLLVCVGRLSPEKGVDELIRALPRLPDCALWLVGDGPFRPALERLSRGLPVCFLGYQSGEALHSVYAVADMFVCPSLTETFGQTVNEALASRVRVALPDVPVFEEAYGDVIPRDAFWTPLDRADMARAISRQLERHAAKDSMGLPNQDKLKSWEDACQLLLEEYRRAGRDRRNAFAPLAWIFFPVWWAWTLTVIAIFFYLAQVRSIFGGSVRMFFREAADVALRKAQGIRAPKKGFAARRRE